MSKVSIVAKLTAAEGKHEELEAALASLIEAANSEAGLEVYAVSADTKDPDTYWFFELYTDAAALEVHGKGDEMKAAMGALGGLLGGRPEVHVARPVAAKGLDL
ncbi:MAG: putative quinol monooxygenase [Acidimicrobiales bacterium]